MPELILDGGHRYWLDGRRIPGVTEILDGLGLVDTRWFTEESRRRGSAVHAAVHYHLEGDLAWSTVDERIKGYVESAIAFLDVVAFKPTHVETRVLHVGPPTFAGTLDLAGEMYGTDSLADWKSGAIVPVTGMQTAGYDVALGGKKRRRRLGVQLRENGKLPRITELDDRRDYARMLNAADLYTHFIFKPKPEESNVSNVA